MDQNFLINVCMKQVWQLCPGTAFGKTSADYVRFSFAASKENIQKALEKIKKMLG